MQDAVIGIDLGGTSTKFGLVSKEGELLAYDAIPTDSTKTYEHFFEHLYHQADKLQHKVDTDIAIQGIGVGAPAGNYCTGTIEDASNLHWEPNIPVTKTLAQVSNLPTVLMNDANASAEGERLYGAAQGMENFISITLGTGLGCGIVIDGRLVVGQRGHAGEIGHTTVFYDGRECSCGRLGCLETYVSGPGLVATVQELLSKKDIESTLGNMRIADMDAKSITAAARQQDQLAREAFNYTGKILGLKLADMVTTLNPEAIIISGGLAKAGALILEPAKRSMEDHLLEMFQDEVTVLPSSLTEKNAAILGASASIWNTLEREQTPYV